MLGERELGEYCGCAESRAYTRIECNWGEKLELEQRPCGGDALRKEINPDT